MQEKTLLCAFGTLKRGFHNHRLIEGSQLIGTGRTKDKYLLTTIDRTPLETVNKDGALIQTFQKHHINITPFPYVMENTSHYFVEIELYLVTRNTLEMCDRLESIPYLYKRKTVDILVNGKDYQGEMYFYNEEFLKINGREPFY